MLPNFLIIGAMKSGTTAISNFLNQHPDIFMHPDKELHFFSTFNVKKYYLENGKISAYTLSDYEKLFNGHNQEKIVGEASTSYLYVNQTASNIKNNIRDVKILAVLRNPILRAFSHYNFMLSRGPESIPSFSKAIQTEKQRILENSDFGHYINRGLYSKQLTNYFDVFDKSQIKVILYDDFCKYPNQILKEIFTFLNVDNNVQINTSDRFQVSGIPKSTILHNILVKPNILKKTFQPLLPKFLYSYFLKLRDKNLSKPKLSRNDYNEIYLIYKDEIADLENLLDLDLSLWKY